MITASTSSRLTADAMPAPSASTASSISSVASWSPCSSACAQIAARQPRAPALLHQLEQVGPAALLDLSLRARASIEARPGVRLDASAAAARAQRAVDLDHHVADLAGAAAPEPRLPVEDQPAADAGAPEHAEQRPVWLAGAELELGVGRDLHVVADVHRRCRAAPRQRRPEREAPVPVRAGCARSTPRRLAASTTPGEPTPTPFSSAGSTPASLRRVDQRRRHLGRRPPRGPPRSASAGAPSRAPCCADRRRSPSIFVPPRSIPPRSGLRAGRRLHVWILADRTERQPQDSR